MRPELVKRNVNPISSEAGSSFCHSKSKNKYIYLSIKNFQRINTLINIFVIILLNKNEILINKYKQK